LQIILPRIESFEKMKYSSIFSYILLGILIVTPIGVFADTAESQAIVRLQAQLASLQQTVTSLLAVAATPASPNQGTGTGSTPAVPAKKSPTPTPVPQMTPIQSVTPTQTSAPEQSEAVKPTTKATQPSGQSETVKPTQQATLVQPTEIKVERAVPMSPEARIERKAVLEQIQIKIQSLQTKLTDLARTTQAQKAVSKLEPKQVKTLQRGSSGDDIKQTQEFLKQFPDVYPQGLATGYFGTATENAVKRVQKKLGLASSGIIDSKTHGKLDEISLAHDRKKNPRINEISPDAISIGTRVTITGIGFTLENNAIAVRGRVVVEGIPSDDGRTLSFPIPPSIRCQTGVACPIKVINKNGISNAKPFKLIDLPSSPEPTPTILPSPSPTLSPSPSPSPSPTPIIVPPMISSISPSIGALGSSVTLAGTGFTATGNAVNFGGTVNAVNGISSVDGGVKLTFTIPSGTSCVPLNACSVSVTNQNGTSNIISFTLTQVVSPVTVVSPNGNEQFTTGRQNTISWKGGTHAVRVALVEDTATNGTDVSSLIMGWISTTAVPASSVTWDAKQVCDISNTICAPISPGNYKILVVSENELGKIEIAQDGSGNWDVSDQPFTVAPSPAITVVYPNGGEKIVQGTSVIISWNATNIASKNVTIRLLKGAIGEFGAYAYIPNVPQSSDTGSFFYTWQVPTGLGDPTDYIMEIYDPSNLAIRDTSDTPFKIVPKSAITVLGPNNGELWVKNFQGTVRWNSANILSKAVTIDLLKSGMLYRTLATNIPQTYSSSAASYTSGTFSYIHNIPTDIPVGSDYTIQVSDAIDAPTTDTSDATFRIIDLPDPITVSGRLIDRFSLASMTNISLYGGKYPYPTTNSNGGFSISTTTTNMNAINRYKTVVGAWPQCYGNWATSLLWRTEGIYVANSSFDNINPSPYSFTRMLEQSDIALGDVPMWPMTTLIAIADTPVRVGITYANSGYYSGSLAVDAMQTVLSNQILALNYDLKVVLTNTAGQNYSSPFINIGLENKCAPKALSFLNGQFTWEPYTIVPASYKSVIGSLAPYTMTTFSPVPYSPSFSVNAGQSFMLTTTLNGGVAPYNWTMLYGALPLGLTLDPLTGIISGTPTTAGIYNFSVLITDNNGVHGAMVIRLTVK